MHARRNRRIRRRRTAAPCAAGPARTPRTLRRRPNAETRFDLWWARGPARHPRGTSCRPTVRAACFAIDPPSGRAETLWARYPAPRVDGQASVGGRTRRAKTHSTLPLSKRTPFRLLGGLEIIIEFISSFFHRHSSFFIDIPRKFTEIYVNHRVSYRRESRYLLRNFRGSRVICEN